MLTFKQYLLESGGNYASIDLAEPLPDMNLAKRYGGSKVCDFHDQHVTLIYSKDSNVSQNKVADYLGRIESIEAKVTGVAAFDSVPKDGERDENLCTIVLKIDSPELEKIHTDLSDMGMTHSYKEYSPHISLLYDFPRDDKDEVMKYIATKIPVGHIVKLSGFKNDVIKKNWTAKL